MIVCISRLGDNDLVAGIHTRHKTKHQRFRATRSYDDFTRVERYADRGVIFHHFLTQAQQSFRRTVFERLAFDVFEFVQSYLRRRQIGLTDVQMMNVDTTTFGGVCQRSKFPDRRCGQNLPAF